MGYPCSPWRSLCPTGVWICGGPLCPIGVGGIWWGTPMARAMSLCPSAPQRCKDLPGKPCPHRDPSSPPRTHGVTPQGRVPPGGGQPPHSSRVPVPWKRPGGSGTCGCRAGPGKRSRCCLVLGLIFKYLHVSANSVHWEQPD